jgi:hypothetical protein
MAESREELISEVSTKPGGVSREPDPTTGEHRTWNSTNSVAVRAKKVSLGELPKVLREMATAIESASVILHDPNHPMHSDLEPWFEVSTAVYQPKPQVTQKAIEVRSASALIEVDVDEAPEGEAPEAEEAEA